MADTNFTPRRGRILAVVDAPASLAQLTRLLEAEGYEVTSADGERALRAAETEAPDLILLDVRESGLTGRQVCRRLKEREATREVPVIFIGETADTAEKVGAFDAGAVDYVTKPYPREELLARVRTHVELRRLRRNLEQMVSQRTRSLEASERRLRGSLYDSISAVAATVEMRDPYTAGHQRRAAVLAVAIAREIELPEHEIEGLYLGGVVHDVGKVKVPSEILSKPGRLSAIEYALMCEHSFSGYEILKAIDFPWPVAEIVLQHHERLDGSGYPRGLKGDDVLLEAQIVGVADVVEAMMSDRPYRAGLGIDAALAEISAGRDVAYRGTVVDACVRLFKEKGFGYSPGRQP